MQIMKMFPDSSSGDVESGSLRYEGSNPFAEKEIRANFIRKVYGILSLQLAFTFTLCGICLFK